MSVTWNTKRNVDISCVVNVSPLLSSTLAPAFTKLPVRRTKSLSEPGMQHLVRSRVLGQRNVRRSELKSNLHPSAFLLQLRKLDKASYLQVGYQEA